VVFIILQMSNIKDILGQTLNEKPVKAPPPCENGTLIAGNICIPYGYMKGEAPEKPTIIKTNFEIDNIRKINDKEMRITVEFYLELVWKDNRIKTKLLEDEVMVLNNKVIETIWKPDLWIKNLHDFKIHNVLEPTSGLMIMNGDNCEVSSCTEKGTKQNTIITYNFEAQATIYCNFRFSNYPMDKQRCDLVIDRAYPISNVVNFVFEIGLFAVTGKNEVLDDFDIEVVFDPVSNQTGIRGTIHLRRNIFPYIIKYYLPCAAIMTMSSLSFFMSKESGAILGRMALLVTQFLTLTNILIAQQVILSDIISSEKYMQHFYQNGKNISMLSN
jgi:hypothetical protein